jgi:hypothetical protein
MHTLVWPNVLADGYEFIYDHEKPIAILSSPYRLDSALDSFASFDDVEVLSEFEFLIMPS